MRIHVTNDKELAAAVREGLKENAGFCPCVKDSLNKPEYQCLCEDFRFNVEVGQPCHCGLYIKDEN